MRSRILICCWNGKGWTTRTYAEPQTWLSEGCWGGLCMSLVAWGNAVNSAYRVWSCWVMEFLVNICDLHMCSCKISHRTEKEKVPLKEACVELPRNAVGKWGLHMWPRRLRWCRWGTGGPWKWGQVDCLLFRRDRQWGGTRLRKCFCSSSLKKQGFAVIEGLIW